MTHFSQSLQQAYNGFEIEMPSSFMDKYDALKSNQISSPVKIHLHSGFSRQTLEGIKRELDLVLVTAGLSGILFHYDNTASALIADVAVSDKEKARQAIREMHRAIEKQKEADLVERSTQARKAAQREKAARQKALNSTKKSLGERPSHRPIRNDKKTDGIYSSGEFSSSTFGQAFSDLFRGGPKR